MGGKKWDSTEKKSRRDRGLGKVKGSSASRKELMKKKKGEVEL